MNKKSVAKNYIFNLINQFLSILLPLITTPYVARILGSNNLGIYSYTLSITTYFVLLGNLGVTLYGQKEIAYVQDNEYKRTKTFLEIFIMKLITSLLSILIFYILFVTYGKYKIYYSILIIELIANMIDITWLFQGMEEFKKTVTKNIIIKIFSILLIFIFIKKPSDLNSYFWIYVLSNLLGSLSLWTYIKRILIKIDLRTLNPFKHIKPCIILFIPQVAVSIYTILDKTMIGLLANDISQVAYYEQSQKIIKVGLVIITSFGAVMLPRISNYFAKNDNKRIKDSLTKSFSFVTMLSIPMLFGFIAVAKSLIPLFLGDEFNKSIILLQMISPILLFVSLTNVIGQQFLLPVKREKQYTISIVVGAITNACLNFILIGFYGALGATIASVIAEFMIFIIMLYYTKKDFDYKMVFVNIGKYLVFSLIMFLLCKTIEFIIKPSLTCLLLQIVLGGFTYFILLYISNDQIIKIFINKFVKIIRGNKNENI